MKSTPIDPYNDPGIWQEYIALLEIPHILISILCLLAGDFHQRVTSYFELAILQELDDV